MAARVLAGRFAPRTRASGGGRPLEEALRRDGAVAGVACGELEVAATGTRPFVEDGVACVLDGRVRIEALASELGIAPAAPERVIARGFERLGASVVERIEGEFALVVWDAERRRGVIARDRLGARPLFLTERDGALLFGSEIRNLLPLLAATPAPDPAAMAYWLARSRTADPRTLYAGIERLPGAHLMRLEASGWRRERWWSPRYRPPRKVSAEEARKEVRAEMTAAVGRSLEGASRPAVMLSGGLDSAAVTAVASESEQQLTAYSAVFPEDAAVDESVAIERVRGGLRLSGVEQRFSGGSALAAAAEFIHEWGVPSVSPNLFVWTPLLRRAAADGVDVVLDGEGGDELFGCARYLVADHVRAGRPLAALRTARRLPGMGRHPRPRWIRRAFVSYGMRGGLPYRAHERLRAVRDPRAAAPDWLADAALAAHLAGQDPWTWKRLDAPRWWAQLAHSLTAVGERLGAPEQLRREGRLAGVELRHPLRDPALVDLVLSLPPELGFDPDVDRPLVRAALRGSLPRETLDGEPKPAFNSLLERALGGPDAAALDELLSDPHPELASRVTRAALDAMLQTSSAPRPLAWALDLWRVAQLEMWLRHLEDAEQPSLLRQNDTATVEFVTRTPQGGSVPA